jgi:hypothetical protein
MTLTTGPAGPSSDDDFEQAGEPARTGLSAWIAHAPAERAPALGIPAVWTAAEILHAAGVSPAFAGAATVAAAGLAYGIGERRVRAEADRDAAQPGAGRPRIRGAELAAATGGIGLWATAAAIWGPLAGPFDLLTLVYGAGVAGGYWWLAAHKAVRAARARRDAAAAAEAEAAARAAAWLEKRTRWHQLAARPGVGLQGSHLLEIEPNRNGETWAVDLYSTRKLASQVDCRQLAQRLAGELGVPRGRVEVTPDPQWVYRIRILFRAGDPWQGGTAGGYVWHPWASGSYNPRAPFGDLLPPARSILDPVPLGADPETGEPLELPLFTSLGASRVLVIATSGSGKSMLLDTIREGVTACADARLLQINLSKGVEDSWWQPLTEASALATDKNPAGRALAILDFITAAYKARPAAPARAAGARTHKPTPAQPALVLIIDEYDEVARDPDRKAAAEQIASKCRSEGIPLILATQRAVGKWVSTSLKANISHLVWSKMRASDARQAAGNEAFALPDMGAYGGGNPGIFGVCEHPTREGMPYSRGRAFFWGNESAGLLQLIATRAAARRPYKLEPALAHLAGQWAQITSGTPPAGGDRYDLATTPKGATVPGTAGVRGKLAAAASLLSGPPPPAAPARPPVGGPGGPGQDQAGDRDAPGADMPDQADRDRLRAFLAGRDGTTVREAARALGLGRDKVWRQLKRWESQGTVELRGQKATANWHATTPGAPAAGAAPYLRAVPDDPARPGPRDGAGDPGQSSP